jgi:uncharacterized alkaline shock family protein YloU
MVIEQLGEISISDQAIRDLARNAALQTYGVVGLARQNLRTGLLQLVRGKEIDRSIVVEREDSKIRLDIFVIIEYGTNLAEVARNLADKARYELEKYTGLEVSGVDVHVREVKMSK